MAKTQAADGISPGRKRSDVPLANAGSVEDELRAMILMGRRNIDTACSINRLAVDCIEQCAERQSEVWSRFSTNVLSMLDIFGARTPGDLTTLGKSSIIADTVSLIIGQMRELSETIARTNQEALDVIRIRSEACFKEIEESAKRNISTLMASGEHSAASPGRGPLARGKRSGPSEET